jgi:DNA modification methylase
MSVKFLTGDAREHLRYLPDSSVHCIVTSPPYFALRAYLPESHPDKAREIGLERSPDAYVAELVAVFRECRRVLRWDGTFFLNIGDSYNNIRSQMGPGQAVHGREKMNGKPAVKSRRRGWAGLKEKDLIGIPWMLAFALRADGWFLRQDIVWSKPNPMPESITDRCTKSHEHVFLLTKSAHYHYNAKAIVELTQDGKGHRNRRSVWTIANVVSGLKHYATMPPLLAELCIKAGCPPGGLVLDPFAGAGTTALVAKRLGRDSLGIELNQDNVQMAEARLAANCPGLGIKAIGQARQVPLCLPES